MNTDSHHPDIPSKESEGAKRASRSSTRSRWIVSTLLFLICIIGVGFLWFHWVQRKETTSSGAKTVSGVAVTTSLAREGDMGVYINALGTVIPVHTVTVKTRVDGELMAVYYREGQTVTKDELLAEIDPHPFQASVLEAQGQLARDEALLNNALIDLARYKSSYEERAVPEQQFATQQAEVNEYRGIVKLDQGNLDSAQVQLGYTQVRAPISGLVGLRPIDAGNIVHSTDSNGLLVITQLQPISVEFSVAEGDLSQIVGQKKEWHEFRVDAFDQNWRAKLAEGRLLAIDNQIDTSTGTVKLRAEFPNSNRALFPNQFVNVRLLVRTLRNVTIVPTAAIQRTAQGVLVYIVRSDQTVQHKNVTVTATTGPLSAVKGVSPGDTVVTSGFDGLQDGAKVLPTPSGAQPVLSNTDDDSGSEQGQPPQQASQTGQDPRGSQ